MLLGIAIGAGGVLILEHGWGWVLALYHKYTGTTP